MASQQVPEKIDKYQIISIIGKGAMGVVYHAYDPIVKRDVAIKLLSSLDLDEPELVSRFEREARLAGGLRHPNIVTIYDLGQFENRPYIAMEFIVGKDLENVIKEKKELSIERKVEILLQICKGLFAAHQKGIIHRDIKPANIRLQDDETVKIMDFGIARMGTSQLTKSGYIIGTLQYMSPEQISGESLDIRTDMFSTGVIAYELFTHSNPFAGGGAVDIMYRILNIRPRPVSDLPEEYSTEINQIIMRAMEKNRELRYPSAKEMAQDLEEFLFYLKTMKFQPKVPKAASYEEGRTRNIPVEELDDVVARSDTRPTPASQNTVVSKPQMPPTVGMDLRSQSFPTFGMPQPEPDPISRTGVGANYSETAQQVLMRPQTSSWHDKKFYILGAIVALLFIGGLILTASFTNTTDTTTNVAVTTNPPGAELIIDGKPFGTTPFTLQERRDMTLTFKMKGYRQKTVALSTEAWPVAVNVKLEPGTPDKPSAVLYSINLESIPPGAEIMLDGKPAGVAPATINLTDEKLHELVFRLSGHKEEKRTIDRNTDAALKIQMEPEAASTGFVRYSGRYPVTIINQGKALKGNPIELPAGTYNLTIRARKGAFIRQTRKVEIVAGETATITEPPMGILTVTAQPSACRISIDGEYVDESPIFDLPVQAGNHVIQFNWETQGERLSKGVSISSGQKEKIKGVPE